MKYTVSTKHCILSEKTLKHLRRHIEKLDQMLPGFDPDLVSLDIVFRRKRERKLNHTNPTPKAPDFIYFEGTIKMVLPKKPLIVCFKENTIDQAVNIGFERLFKEIETYKGKHFPNDSEFYNHDTIRKGGV